MKTILAATAFLLSVSLNALTQATGNGVLRIRASHFSSDDGKALAKLYRREDEMPDRPFMETSVTIDDGQAVIVFADIPYGEYALIVCHDENANGKIDHNFFGIPAEPLGFSNGWKLTLFSGMPSFSKLSFAFSEQQQEYKVDME